MTLFMGGPFDGADLPFDPRFMKRVRLPAKDHFDSFLEDLEDTAEQDWPHQYEADEFIDFPVYRYVSKAA